MIYCTLLDITNFIFTTLLGYVWTITKLPDIFFRNVCPSIVEIRVVSDSHIISEWGSIFTVNHNCLWKRVMLIRLKQILRGITYNHQIQPLLQKNNGTLCLFFLLVRISQSIPSSLQAGVFLNKHKPHFFHPSPSLLNFCANLCYKCLGLIIKCLYPDFKPQTLPRVYLSCTLCCLIPSILIFSDSSFSL